MIRATWRYSREGARTVETTSLQFLPQSAPQNTRPFGLLSTFGQGDLVEADRLDGCVGEEFVDDTLYPLAKLSQFWIG